MDQTWIGAWVARYRTEHGWSTTRLHRVESIIADRVVTNCGREMERETKRGVLNRVKGEVRPDASCRQCLP